jgi:hypothetical protein
MDRSVTPEEKRALVAWAVACAEMTLVLLDERQCNDARIRAALDAADAWMRGTCTVSEVRASASAAHAAARESDDAVVRAAARAVGHAAATAHVAGHARAAAHYAVKALVAAGDPARALAIAIDIRGRQESLLPAALRPFVFGE